MANLTLSLDAELLRRARIRALERGTSVNAIVREYLEEYARMGSARDPVRGFLTVAERAKASSGRGGRTWTRDDAHHR
ncbi:MAG: DUF6364 family protein [Actinomycetota bacterium]